LLDSLLQEMFSSHLVTLIVSYFASRLCYGFGPDIVEWNGQCIEKTKDITSIFKKIYHSSAYYNKDGIVRHVTPRSCIDYCKIQKYKYAGLTWTPSRRYYPTKGPECHCGNGPMPFHKIRYATDCKQNCDPDITFRCGAYDRLNVFDVKISTGQLWNLCVEDTGFSRLLEHLQPDNDVNKKDASPNYCLSYCGSKGYRYAGLHGKSCHCGNSLPPPSKTRPANECNKLCKDRHFICGGDLRMNIYSSQDWIQMTTGRDSGCQASKKECYYLPNNHDGEEFTVKNYNICLKKCCANQKCKSFNFGVKRGNGYKCVINYLTQESKQLVLENFYHRNCKWSYHELI